MAASYPLLTSIGPFYSPQMDSRSIGILALGFIAVVWSWQMGVLFAIAFVALFATADNRAQNGITGAVLPYR